MLPIAQLVQRMKKMRENKHLLITLMITQSVTQKLYFECLETCSFSHRSQSATTFHFPWLLTLIPAPRTPETFHSAKSGWWPLQATPEKAFVVLSSTLSKPALHFLPARSVEAWLYSCVSEHDAKMENGTKQEHCFPWSFLTKITPSHTPPTPPYPLRSKSHPSQEGS